MKHIQRTRKVLIAGRWFLILGLVFYSLMTTTPFVSEHSEWAWSGWALGLIVDAAFIMSLSAESTLATLGVRKLGKWPAAFRWFTGLSSVFLNIWVSVAARDWVGAAVHLIAPALVMLLAEVGPVYMAALAQAEREAERANPLDSLQLADWEHELLDAPPAKSWRARVLDNHRGELDEWLAKEEPLPEPTASAEPIVEAPQAKLSRAEAAAIIEQGWRHKLSVSEVAAASQRHPSTVRRKFKELETTIN